MCDDAAVSWSDYESFRSQVESSVRTKISEELRKHVAECRDLGLPGEYIIGMERARLFVLLNTPLEVPKSAHGVQDKLF